jgi:hypothetical protein
MDNTNSILIIFLIAAFNTLIVVIAVHFILKIKMKRNDFRKQVKAELQNEISRTEDNEFRKKLISKEKLINEAEDSDNKKNDTYPQKDEHPKFLKYTPKGYIDPGKDEKKKQHVWR